MHSAFAFLATSSKQTIFTLYLSAIGSSPGIVQLNSERTISIAPVDKTASLVKLLPACPANTS